MAFALRPAGAEDISAIEGIIAAAYSHYIPRIGRPPGPMLDDYAALVREGVVQVAEEAGRIAGVLVLIPQEDFMLLDNIAVSPLAQGKGLGRLMLAAAETAAREAGFGSIRLYTNEAMTENLGLYVRIGYAETHRAEEKGLRRVYMAKAL